MASSGSTVSALVAAARDWHRAKVEFDASWVAWNHSHPGDGAGSRLRESDERKRAAWKKLLDAIAALAAESEA